MSDLIYLISVLLSIGVYFAAAVLLWVAVEAVHYIYCKITGKRY